MSTFNGHLRYKGIDAEERNQLLRFSVIFKVAMCLQVNELASLGQQPVATTPEALLTMMIHCNKHSVIM